MQGEDLRRNSTLSEGRVSHFLLKKIHVQSLNWPGNNRAKNPSRERRRFELQGDVIGVTTREGHLIAQVLELN